MVCSRDTGRVSPRAGTACQSAPQECKALLIPSSPTGAVPVHIARLLLSFPCVVNTNRGIPSVSVRFPVATSPAVSRGSVSHLARHDQCINAATCYSAYSRNPRGAIFPEKSVSLCSNTGFASCLRELKEGR